MAFPFAFLGVTILSINNSIFDGEGIINNMTHDWKVVTGMFWKRRNIMLEMIKRDQKSARLEYRKDKTPELRIKSSLLTTLVGELENVAKSKTVTEEITQGLVTKFLKGAKDSLPHARGEDEVIRLQEEIKILEGYLPVQLTELDLSLIVKQYLVENEGVNIGQVMGYLKSSYNGQFDGKLASKIVRDLL